MLRFIIFLVTVKLIIICIFISTSHFSQPLTCRHPFEGFGVYLGQLGSFNKTSADLRESIISLVYHDLMIRNFRTEYLPDFSTKDNTYAIKCVNVNTCTWITLHSLISELPNKSIIVSMWSPPYYMINNERILKAEYEKAYYYYLTNVTQLVKDQFNLTIDQISIVNEPENVFANWDQCTMSADQLCRLIQEYDDPMISLCPENAWFPVSKVYFNYSSQNINCRRACHTFISHGYMLTLNPLYWDSVYYDTLTYPEDRESPTWITEISSTRKMAQLHQIGEAIDMSKSIINFVGITCVQRYYYWLTFTSFPSGESLIWFDTATRRIILPKKYYAFRHFCVASSHPSGYRSICSSNGYLCLKFTTKTVYVNPGYLKAKINNTCDLCCTTDDYHYVCMASDTLPARSVCSC